MTESDKIEVNVLLVDDTAVNLLALRSVLEGLDVNLIEANSGQEALRYVNERDFAVVLLDVMMPGMDGFEAARRIRQLERSRYTPIIFVTAKFVTEKDAFRGYTSGAVDYITKPFEPEILRSKVSVFVDLYSKSEQVKRQADHIRAMEVREYESRLAALEERMAAETERERAEIMAVRAVLEHAPVAFARLDADNKIIETNPAFARQFVSAAVVAGASPSAVTALSGLPKVVHQAIEMREPYLVHDMRLDENAPPLSSRYSDLAVWPVTNGGGKFAGTILVATDVTERVLRDQQRQDFVATLAHDLQTPVIASDRALGLLLNKIEGTVSDDLINFVSMLRENNQNLLHMIEGLLDSYHYERGASCLYFDVVDLNLLATACLDELASLIEAQGLVVHRQLAPDLLPVRADRTAMRRVVTNLLDNSINFTPRGGVITVVTSNIKNRVVLQVIDTGVGIKPEHKEHLFERFWHGNERSAYKASRGLGLYLCRQITESHAGTIDCQSTPGKQTIFEITLPSMELAGVSGNAGSNGDEPP